MRKVDYSSLLILAIKTVLKRIPLLELGRQRQSDNGGNSNTTIIIKFPETDADASSYSIVKGER
jgi:hypothetical protein